MFSSGMRESSQERVNIHGVQPEVLDTLLRYTYTSELDVTMDNVQVIHYLS